MKSHSLWPIGHYREETDATGEPAKYGWAYVSFCRFLGIFITGDPQKRYESADPGNFFDVPMYFLLPSKDPDIEFVPL